MKLWDVRSSEADIVAPFVDALGFFVGHWTDDNFTKRIKEATATTDRLKKVLVLWQCLWRVGEFRLTEAVTSPEFFDWNLRVRVSGFGLNCLSGLDCEPYSPTLVRALNWPLSQKLRDKIVQTGKPFDLVTPGTRTTATRPSAPAFSMYSDSGFTSLGKTTVRQGTYRNYPELKPTVNIGDFVGIAVSKFSPLHEYKPAEALDPARWFNSNGWNLCYFPVGTNDEVLATANEFAQIARR